MSTELAQFDELKANVTLFVQPLSGLIVSDAASNAAALGALKTVKELTKQIEARRDAAVRPLNNRVDSVNDYAKEIKAPLAEAEKLIKGRMAEYADVQRKIQEEERRKAEEVRREAERKADEERKRIEAEAKAKRDAELKRLQEEEEVRARELAQKQKEEREALAEFGIDPEEERNKAEQEVLNAKRKAESDRLALEQRLAKEKAAEEARIDRERKEREAEARKQAAEFKASRSKNTRMVSKFEIIDPSKIPDEYWRVDESAIGLAVRGGIKDISGVRIWEETTIVAR